MGIKNLLTLLKSITDDVHISQYAGQTVAVDALCWYNRIYNHPTPSLFKKTCTVD